MTAHGLFVAGTDTDVGKTLVAAALVALYRSHEVDAVPMKPVQSGPDDDIGVMLKLNSLTLDAADRRDANPFHFKLPASPHLAAAREKETVSLPKIVAAFHRLAKRHEAVIVEGSGGLLVPLNHRHLVIDVAAALEMPVLLVARAGLGTLNHTLLSVEALCQRRIPIAGIALNTRGIKPGTIEMDNLKTLRALTGVPVEFVGRMVAGKLSAVFPALQRMIKSPAG